MSDTKIKIGQIGDVVNAFQVEKIDYFSNRNFSDFEVLLVKVSKLSRELADLLRLLHRPRHQELDAFLEWTRAELSMFFDHCGLVLLFVDQIPSINLVEPLEGFQMSNENEFSLMMLDANDFDLQHKVGKEFAPLHEFEELHKHFRFKYQFLWNKVAGTPIFKPKRGKGYAGFKFKVGKGWIYGLPEAMYQPSFDHITTRDFLSDIQQLYDKASKDSSALKVPAWAEKYLIGNEQQYVVIKKELEKEKAELESKIIENEKQLEKFSELKRLLFAGDDALEQVVEDVFRNFGFKVVVPDGNNDDLNILEDDFTAVVEIKGLTKSASTANGMQLEKWVSNYGIDNNIVAKGILIVNAFKDLAPKDRKEKAYPADLLSFSTKRDHCLMLTLNLLNIYVDYERGFITKDEIKNLLSSTVGVLYYESRFNFG